MLNVIYEDNHILVVVKPQNIPCQEDESKDSDLLSMCKQYLKETYNKPGNVYCGLVHRLDRPTGGVMVFAKTSKAAARLSEQLKTEQFEKKYLAVTVGSPTVNTDYLVHYLKKNPASNIVNIVPQTTEGAKRAELRYKVLDANNKLALLEVEIFTGRSHQIRVQLNSIGNPIFADAKYGGDIVKGQNMALWAYKLSFKHPVQDKVLNFTVYPPVEEMPWNLFDINKILG